jgi:hypothetical protein
MAASISTGSPSLSIRRQSLCIQAYFGVQRFAAFDPIVLDGNHLNITGTGDRDSITITRTTPARSMSHSVNLSTAWTRSTSTP